MANGMSAFLDQIQEAETRYKANSKERAEKERELKRLKTTGKANWRKLDTAKRYFKRLETLGLADEISDMIDDQEDFNPLERIIRNNDLKSVQIIEGGAVAARSVARIVIRDPSGFELGFGTGSMVSPRLLMTNNHVLETEDMAQQSFVEFNFLRGLARDYPPIVFNLQPDVFFETNKERDVTIVAVEPVNSAGIPVHTRGYTRLIRESGKATVGERVNIIQHPGGERMQLAYRDNTISAVSDHVLQYVADTMRGSSGAPVFNDQLSLAALHHSGVPKRKNGKILLVDGSPWSETDKDRHLIDWISNEGIRISRITEFVDGLGLTGAKFDLWQQCFEIPTRFDFWATLDSIAAGFTPESDAAEFAADPDSTKNYTMQQEANGTVSYYFRLNFGPADNPTSTQTRNPIPIQPKSSPPSPLPPKLRSGHPGFPNVRDLAEQHLRSHSDKGPYYDKKRDQDAANNYYNGLNLKASSKPLFDSLNQLLEDTHTKVHSYQKTRLTFLYPRVDLHEDGKLHHIYSGDAFDPVEAISSEIASVLRRTKAQDLEATVLKLDSLLERDELWNSLEETEAHSPFNCEHVVPQSWFAGETPMKEDLHHLFTCEWGCNSFRNKYPYFQFPIEDEAERSKCGRRETSGFEPDHGKGAVARATMYFLMRYPGQIGDDEGEMVKNRTRLLLDWHKGHEITNYERHRNMVIHEVQGNRNPFIDHPKIATEALLKRGFH